MIQNHPLPSPGEDGPRSVSATDVMGDDLRPEPETMTPVHLLEEHLDREEAWLHERHRELVAAREIIEQMVTSPSSGAGSRGVEPISDELAPSVVGRLLRETRGVLRNLVQVLDIGPALDATTLRQNEAWMAEGNEQRAIYPADALETPAARQWIQAWAGVGEKQRVADSTASEFAVFGDIAAVGLLRWGDPEGGYAIYRDPMVIHGMKEYFDLAWAHAQPVPTGIGVEDVDDRIVELLGQGLKDEAIARLTGASLRTVRRRIAKLMADNGVQTRFQLGAVLGRPFPVRR